jgi:hypothetical protein
MKSRRLAWRNARARSRLTLSEYHFARKEDRMMARATKSGWFFAACLSAAALEASAANAQKNRTADEIAIIAVTALRVARPQFPDSIVLSLPQVEQVRAAGQMPSPIGTGLSRDILTRMLTLYPVDTVVAGGDHSTPCVRGGCAPSVRRALFGISLGIDRADTVTVRFQWRTTARGDDIARGQPAIRSLWVDLVKKGDSWVAVKVYSPRFAGTI